MKTYSNLYDRITAFDNLLLAAKKAQKGKRFKKNTAHFNFELERELLQLQEELKNKTYAPGKYKQFYVKDTKKRLISAAPYRDRVAHHALMNVVAPLFERSFIFDSTANQKGKGNHKAMVRFKRFFRANKFVLRCDIKKYFPSIDRGILFSMIQKKIKCPDTLWLIKTILDHTPPQETVYDYFDGDDLFSPYEREKGLPIGNLTSQFFANVYLNGFDHYVKEVLGCRAYVRYVDDFAVCADDKAFLWDVKEKMVEYLGQHLRLRLHPVKTRVYQTREGVEFLGFRIFLDRVRLRKENVRRFMARLKRMRTDFQSGTLGKEKIIQRITSWIAHARWADSARLRRVCLKAYLGVNLRNASRLIL